MLDKDRAAGDQASQRYQRPVVRCGRYVLGQQLGRGGTAAVYRAQHAVTGRQVAIKIIAPHLLDHPPALARFEAEARMAMWIDHPNVIRVLEMGRLENGTPYQVMELLEGQDLAAVLRGRGTFTPREALPYLQQICAGLQSSHDHGVVHRDLKPRNIFVLDGEPLRLKLLDFGIARLLESDGARLTAAGVAIGTPLFMAPEQAIGDQERISPRTDLYSLGVILHLMLTGRTPSGGDEDAVVSPPPTELPVALGEVIRRCLAERPEDRPASAAEVAELYEAALESTVVDGAAPWLASDGLAAREAEYDASGHLALLAVEPDDGSALELHAAPTVLFRQPLPPGPIRRTDTTRVRRMPILAVAIGLLLGALVLFVIYLLLPSS